MHFEMARAENPNLHELLKGTKAIPAGMAFALA